MQSSADGLVRELRELANESELAKLRRRLPTGEEAFGLRMRDLFDDGAGAPRPASRRGRDAARRGGVRAPDGRLLHPGLQGPPDAVRGRAGRAVRALPAPPRPHHRLGHGRPRRPPCGRRLPRRPQPGAARGARRRRSRCSDVPPSPLRSTSSPTAATRTWPAASTSRGGWRSTPILWCTTRWGSSSSTRAVVSRTRWPAFLGAYAAVHAAGGVAAGHREAAG